MESCFDILVPRFFPEEEECLPSLQQTPTRETLAEAGGEKAEFRGRVLSSDGSFASLESGGGSEGGGVRERRGKMMQGRVLRRRVIRVRRVQRMKARLVRREGVKVVMNRMSSGKKLILFLGRPL